MGHVRVSAEVSGKRKERVDFLVDTGATFTVVPPELAARVAAPLSPRRFAVTLTDGRQKRLRACTLGVKIGRRETPATALLMPGVEPLLGVETLEALGLRVDPRTGKLEPTRGKTALLAGVRAGAWSRRARV